VYDEIKGELPCEEKFSSTTPSESLVVRNLFFSNRFFPVDRLLLEVVELVGTLEADEDGVAGESEDGDDCIL